jgi:hypothetical protein
MLNGYPVLYLTSFVIYIALAAMITVKTRGGNKRLFLTFLIASARGY